MDFVSNQKLQIETMLKEMGIGAISDLFDAIPPALILPRPQVDDGLSEFEALERMRSLADKNTYPSYDNYLGGGAYEHYIPAIVDAICSKSEFLTSYTPYQAEASQGMLQAIYEYQTAICALTGMDVSNASLYDGASACAEALLMAMRIKKERNEIILSPTLNPRYRAVIEQYLASHDVVLKTLPLESDCRIHSQTLGQNLNERTIAVIHQSPNFFGLVEETAALAELVKAKGALLILASDILSYGLYASAREVNADIAVGDTQSFGLPLEFGGPYVGYLACRKEYIRQMPGRYVGETVDDQGRRGFVLTLQAREQHIRREKATSNICTNQALAALASLIAMAWYGKEGIAKLAQANYSRACYLKECLSSLKNVKIISTASHFNEFVIAFDQPHHLIEKHFMRHHIYPGLHLGTYYPKLENHFLVAVTETKSKAQLDRYVEASKLENI